MRLLLYFMFLLSSSLGFTQNEGFPDEEASFPGGAAEMKRFIQENMRYPEVALQDWDQGRVYVTFIVEKDGRLTNIGVMRGGLTAELNAEAMRIISVMPRWIFGTVNGEAVRSRCRLPITFTLGGRPPRKIRRQQRRNK